MRAPVPSTPPRRPARWCAVLLGLTLLAAAGCRSAGGDAGTSGPTPAPPAAVVTTGTASPGPVAPAGAAPTLAGQAGVGLFDTSYLHTIAVTFDEGEYAAMVETFRRTGDKDWIEAEVTIDGETHRRAGLRLKGNSSLFGLLRPDRPGGVERPPSPSGAGADQPEALPWLIRLDRFVEDQSHQGLTELVVRSNITRTAMNEAVAVELLGEAGLPTQRAVGVRFSANDRPAMLRLVLENPDARWAAANLGPGPLYKADADGDYRYRGEDPDAYGAAWDQEAGEDDLAPLIDFLDFLNNADDRTFAAELPERLDVEAFATYLAVEELLGNWDDISGPGNNSYLYVDPELTRFTVVAWDHNLALVPRPGGPRASAEGPGNVLADRFLAVDELASRYDEALDRLREQLVDSGYAESVVRRWADLLLAEAGDLVSPYTVRAEAAAIASYLSPS
jgi:hypothetical protein